MLDEAAIRHGERQRILGRLRNAVDSTGARMVLACCNCGLLQVACGDMVPCLECGEIRANCPVQGPQGPPCPRCGAPEDMDKGEGPFTECWCWSPERDELPPWVKPAAAPSPKGGAK